MSNETAIISLQEKIDELNRQAWEVRVTDLPRAFELSQESVKLARSIKYSKGLAEGLRSLGFSYVRFFKNDQAAPLLKESLSIFQSLNDLKGQAVVYEYMGILERNKGNLGTSLELLLKGSNIVQQTGPLEVEVTTAYHIGVTYKHLGNHENALDYLYRALSLAKEINLTLMEAYAINIIGSIYFDNGDYNQALDCYQRGLIIRQQSNDKWGEAGSLDNIGFTYLKLKDLDKAIEYCKQSLKITQATGDKKGEANTLLHLAEIYQHAGDIGQASKSSNESLEIRKARGDKRGEAEVLLFLADLHKDQSDLHDHPIFEWLSQALKIAEEIKAQDLLSKAYYNLHEYYQQSGNFKESLLQLEAHFQIERELHKNSINQKVANLEISHKAEVVSQRNKELTELNEKIEKANEELKIERSLERVRTAAMAMKEPADMLEVCKIISDQLEVLDVKKIRNVQTAIFYDEKNAYMNYEYYARHDKLLITEVDYNNHPVAEKFANQMLKGPNQVWTHGFIGEEVKDWLKYQRSTNVFIDSYLETADSLNYYWYSLGPVALGMSTYVPLNENEIDLFKRFRNVFELAYRRYLDIEKAEAQAREAQIELALERVRARTMAMHHSGELADTASVLFQQIKELGFETWSCGFCTWTKNDLVEVWMAADSGGLLPPMMIPYKEEPTHSKIYEASLRGETAYDNVWEGKELEKHYDFLKTIPSVKDAIEILERSGLSLPSRQCYYVGFFNQGYLLLITKEPNADLKDLSRRFAKVFEQTYTRFLDLQKAEEQAREAQIEAALEKVRSRSLAMHKSEELQEVVTVVFDRLKELDIQMDAINLDIFRENIKDSYLWTSVPGQVYSKEFHVPFTDVAIFKDIYDGLIEGKELLSKVYSREEKNAFFEYIFTHSDFREVPENRKKLILDADGCTFSVAYAKSAAIMAYRYSQTPFSDGENEILKRFAKVFEQCYTRFKDLQKAEAQAREAKIETALERVRSNTMAMHHSEELKEVISVTFEQIKSLDIIIDSCIITLFIEGSDDLNNWVASAEQKYLHNVRVPYFKHPLFDKIALAKKKPGSYFTLKLSQKENQIFYTHIIENSDFGKIINEDRKRLVMNAESNIMSFANFQHTGLRVGNFRNHAYTEEENNIILRFANVFEQTYTRFLDLQKAEAQAREAKIEAALERVRARTMAMHHSGELADVAQLLFQQVKDLGISAWTTGFNIWQPDNTAYIDWITGPTGDFLEPYTVHLTEHSAFRDIMEARLRGDDFFVSYLEGEQIIETYRLLSSFGDKGQFQKILESGIQFPTRQYNHFVFGAQVSLMFITYEPYPEAHDIFKRFGKVFEQTYTRFLDLQKAEAQAREAQIEAALERVRAKAMAMHKSDDLTPAVATVFEELEKLNMGILRCGIAILDKETPRGDIWVTVKSEQKSTIQLSGDEPMDYHPLLQSAYDAWLKQEDFSYILKGEELAGYYRAVTKVNFQLPISATFDAEIKDQKQFYYNAVFQDGSLFAFMETDAIDEAKLVMKRFANVFNLTYKRFLDLQKAEAQTHKANIETALERVRARALAMQQPEELIEVAEVLRHEMGLLGVEELETCSIYIHDETILRTECWYALKDPRVAEKKLVSDHFPLNLNDTWVGREMAKFYKSDAKQVSIVMQGANRKEWINYCEEKSVPFRGYYGEVIPDRTYHLYKFSHGAIGAASAGDISNVSWELLSRASSVFSLAYSRFKDLTQARGDLVKLKEEKKRAEDALTELQTTQKQLIQAEKMASLGELTAGIAHEIQNPLNFVNNFSDVSNELLEEMKAELEKGNAEGAKEIAIDVKENLEKILHHGKRADAIVKGMLQHSRSSSGQKELTDINTLAEEYLRLAYHGLRAKDKFFNAKFETDLDPSITKINIVPQEIGRVILNLINNSFYAVSEKKKLLGNGFEPAVTVSTKAVKLPLGGLGAIEIRVMDNGNGIPKKVLDKIFQPFFTTKPTGQGTGLGLSLSYDIVTKGHDGEIKVETKEGEGSAFIISLPMK